MKTEKQTEITITFDGEVWSAWVDGKEVSTDRRLGVLKSRMGKRYEHVTFIQQEEVK